jgi:hypothetical protein
MMDSAMYDPTYKILDLSQEESRYNITHTSSITTVTTLYPVFTTPHSCT